MTVQVRLENQPPTGFQAAQPTVEPGEVAVRGPADALREVVSVIAQVRFSDAPNDLALTPRALPLDAAGHEVPDVEAMPHNVFVTVPVRAATPTRTVGVIPILRGQPSPGYWVAAAVADPAVVTVRGDPSALESIDLVTTVTIDVSGASSDRLVRAALVLPSGTSLARDVGTVQVSISVRPLSGTRAFPLVAVQATGVAEGLTATATPASIDVLLAGTVPLLESIRPEQVTATVDLSGRGPGTYELDATVRAPSGATITVPGGARISVVVRSR
jgi:YbbR domain-containing protein